MSRQLTKKERGFANSYLDTNNGTAAALANYDTTDENTAAVIASRTLRKAKVQDYLQDKAEHAAAIVYEIATGGENDNVKLGAAKDILDRAGHKPTDKTLNVNIDMAAQPSEEIIEYANAFLGQQKTT